jgi:hypothetical protein
MYDILKRSSLAILGVYETHDGGSQIGMNTKEKKSARSAKHIAGFSELASS